MTAYKIIRQYQNRPTRVIKKNLSFWEAAEHCQNPETAWVTCKKKHNRARTRRFGQWADGFTKQ